MKTIFWFLFFVLNQRDQVLLVLFWVKKFFLEDFFVPLILVLILLHLKPVFFIFGLLFFVLLDWDFVPHCLTLPFTFCSLLSIIILLFVHLAESLDMFICWFCSCLEMFLIIPHFMKHLSCLFIVFVIHW